MLNVGILGYGLAGTVFHAPFVRAVPRLQLAAVATSRPAEAADDFRRIADPQSLIADPDLDLVVIATPNATHVPLARAALEAGKHVVIDKPFAPTAAEAAELIALAERRGRLLTPFHNRRWDGDLLTVRKLVEEGTLGDLLQVEFCWDRFRPAIREGWKDSPEPGAGLLFDLGAHLVDQALLLFGVPKAVSAGIFLDRPGAPVDDGFDLRLDYGALRVRLAASMMIREPRPRFALHGTRASFVKYGVDPQEDALKAGGSPSDAGYGEEWPESFGRLTADDGIRAVPSLRGDYTGFYEAVAASILDGAPPPVDPRDALAGLRIIERAQASARSKCWEECGG
jgi:scyllo-inositol 2-dehydrogenase (NADP+)